MKTSLIILSKVGGGAGGFGALIIVAIVFFYLWVNDDNGDLGCLSILFLPLLLPYIYGKLVYKVMRNYLPSNRKARVSIHHPVYF